MSYLINKSILLVITLFSLGFISASESWPAEPEKSELKVSAGLNIRLRNELWDTFEKQGASESTTGRRFYMENQNLTG